MSLLRRTRAEVAGAVRSLRYDLGKHPVEPPAGGPDVTSTGMSTFGGLPIEEPPTGYAGRRPPPRKAVAVGALGLLTVAGAAGAYLTVVNGLGSLVSQAPAAADALPARPVVTAEAQIGAGPVTVPRRTGTAAATTTTPDGRVVTGQVVPPPPEPPAAGAPARPGKNTSPVRTTAPASPECRCEPPVPTPTAPTSSPSPTPSATPASSSEPDPTSPSATPDDSADPSESPQSRRHRHRP